MRITFNLVGLSGMGLIVQGCWDLHPSAGMIVAGVLALLIAFFATVGDMADGPREGNTGPSR